jgi:chemotaxis signal transduction protein
MAKYLNFKLEGIIFAIPVDYVFEVTKYKKLRAIPVVN